MQDGLIGLDTYLDEYQKYSFSPEEIMIIAVVAKNLGDDEIISKILQDREKFGFSEMNTVEFLDLFGKDKIIEIIKNATKYDISNLELSNLICLIQDEKFILKWIEENKDVYSFTEEEFFTMLLASKNESIIQSYIRKKHTSISNMEKITLPSNMSIGIELESEGKNSYVILQMQELFDKWNVKDDISLNKGIEVVSPIIYGNESTRDIYQVCERLKLAGQVSNKNCGGHIHIGANYLTSAQSYRNLIDLWTNTEKIMYLISNCAGELPRNGVNLYASPISKVIKEALAGENVDLETENDLDVFVKKLIQIQIEGKKSSNILVRKSYCGINFLNINNNSKKTIEFRIANGTIEPGTIIKNINLFGGLVRVSEELYKIQMLNENERNEQQKEKMGLFEIVINSDNELTKLKALLRLVVGNDMEYYINRYIVNSKLLEKQNDEIKHMLDEITLKGTNMLSRYLDSASRISKEGNKTKQDISHDEDGR